MASVNKAIIVGHLGNDPEVRYLQNGDQVTTVSIATSETWTDKGSGEKKESTEWHRVVFWRKLAEIAGQYLTKGAQVYIEGKIKTRKWQDSDGNDRYSTEIHADEMKMLGGRGERRENGERQGGDERREPSPRPAAPAGGDNFDDDIPF